MSKNTKIIAVAIAVLAVVLFFKIYFLSSGLPGKEAISEQIQTYQDISQIKNLIAQNYEQLREIQKTVFYILILSIVNIGITVYFLVRRRTARKNKNSQQ